MSANKNELITKLEKISELYSDTVQIAKEIKDFTPEDNYKRKHAKPKFTALPDEGFEDIIDHDDADAEEIMALGYEKAMAPKRPEKPVIEEFKSPSRSTTKNMGCLSWVGIIGAGFIIVGGLMDTSVFTMPLSYIFIAIFVGIFLFSKFKEKQAEGIAKKKAAEALENYNQNKADTLAKYDSDLKAYEESYAAFTAEKEKVMKEYKVWRKKYLAYLSEEAAIEEKLQADRALAVNRMFEEKFTPAKAKLDEYNDLISEEYLPSINTIIGLLKSGRADDLKEAINLYEEIVYKEKQLQLEREKEEQRRLEEERRRQDEERRYREEMNFKESQERQRRREAEQQRRDEERRFSEQQRMQEEHNRNMQRAEQQRAAQERNAQRKADEDRRYAEQQQMHTCRRCRKYSSCRNQGKVIGCGAFDPIN